MAFELLLGDREFDRVLVTERDKEGEVDSLGESVDEGEWEGDLEDMGEAEKALLAVRVTTPVEEVLGDNDPERVIDGERERLGELESVEDSEVLEQRVGERVGERVREGLRVIDGEEEKVLETVGDTLCEGVGEALGVLLEDREFERVSVTVWDKDGEEELLGKSVDEGDWEGDLEGKGDLEREMLVERVKVPLEEVLGNKDPEIDTVDERVKLGEVVSVKKVVELGHSVVDRVGEREMDGLRDTDGEAVNVIDRVGEIVVVTLPHWVGVRDG